jgi:hypothetical protein
MSEESKGVVFDIGGELNPGKPFEMEGGGKVWLRVCAGDDLRDIRKKTVKKKIEYKKVDGNMQRLSFEDIDEDLQSQMVWDFCIVKWENFFADAAKTIPIPCTTDNKLKLMGRSLVFSKFVGESLQTLRGTLESEEMVIEKN